MKTKTILRISLLRCSLLFLLINLSITTNSNSQIQPTFIDIQFIDSRHGWLISRQGDILNYESDKEQWKKIHKLDSFLRSIYFINNEFGFACGWSANCLFPAPKYFIKSIGFVSRRYPVFLR